MALFKIFKDKSGKYRFFLKANDNQIVFVSRSYSKRIVCLNHIELIKRYALKDEKYERYIYKVDNPYFTLKAFKNDVVGISEKFLNENIMESIIALIKANAKNAKIDYTTYSM